MFKAFLKLIKYLLILLLGVVLVILIWFFTPPIWRNMVTYPRLEKQVADLNKLKKEPAGVTDLKVYRGVMHVHSYLSHDSEGKLTDIVPAAKNNGIEFVFLTGRLTLADLTEGFLQQVQIYPVSQRDEYQIRLPLCQHSDPS